MDPSGYIVRSGELTVVVFEYADGDMVDFGAWKYVLQGHRWLRRSVGSVN